LRSALIFGGEKYNPRIHSTEMVSPTLISFPSSSMGRDTIPHCSPKSLECNWPLQFWLPPPVGRGVGEKTVKMFPSHEKPKHVNTTWQTRWKNQELTYKYQFNLCLFPLAQ